MVFALRWIMAPFYVGLIGALLMLAVKFVQKLVTAIPVLLEQSVGDTIFTVLALVDITLVANLVMILMFAGWENFIGQLQRGAGKHDLAWLGSLNFGEVKVRLIGSVMVIATITILESFVHVDQMARETIIWQLAVLLGIGVTGVLLAVMDYLAEKGAAAQPGHRGRQA